MCEFCEEHGEGKKWYLQMRNYSEELLHQELSSRQKEATRASTRAEWLGRFCDYFEAPAISGVPKPLEQLFAAVGSTAELRGPAAGAGEVVEGRKVTHFGQVTRSKMSRR